MLNTDVELVGSYRWKELLYRWRSCGSATFWLGGAKPLTRLGHVALIGINGIGIVLCGIGSSEARPRSIIDILDGAQTGGIDREAC